MDLVIYHGGSCLDGFCSAWVVHQHFPNAEYLACNYGDPLPDQIDGRDIVVVDFSWKREQMIEMKRRAKSLVVLDHHKTAEAELRGLDFCVFNNEKSGASLAWEFFNDTPAPWVVQYVEDADLWRWALPYSREIKAAISSYDLTFDTLDRLAKEPLCLGDTTLVEEGQAILRFKKQMVDLAVKNAEVVEIAGHKVLQCNVSASALISDVGHELAKGRPFGLTWFEKDGRRIFSLRSVEGGMDVSEIAKMFGGGGHKHAAGFFTKIKADEPEVARDAARYDVSVVEGVLRLDFGRPVRILELDRGSAMVLASNLRSKAGDL